MPGPTTRRELRDGLETAARKLFGEIDAAIDALGPERSGALSLSEDWSLVDVLVVREWWTRAVTSWCIAGVRGDVPVLPAEGYAWRETPRLNADVIAARGEVSLEQIRAELERSAVALVTAFEERSDAELLRTGVFEWAGKWPLARWIAVNSTRQYTTARTMLRRALRDQGDAT